MIVVGIRYDTGRTGEFKKWAFDAAKAARSSRRSSRGSPTNTDHLILNRFDRECKQSTETKLSEPGTMAMNKLAQQAIDAHGGLERWSGFSRLSAHVIDGGELWAAKGKAGILADVTVSIDLRDEKASHWPFGSPDRRSRFEPHRVAL